VTAELIWISGGMLAEIDNVVDTLKPHFYSSFVTTDAAAGGSSGHRAMSTTASASPHANAALNGRTPVLTAYAHAMQSEIDEVVKPVTAASEAFLETYDSKLNALLAQYNLPSAKSAAELDSRTVGEPSPRAATATTTATTRLAAASSSAEEEEVVEHRVEGVGSWASSLVTMAAVAAGVALEARRKRAHYSEL